MAARLSGWAIPNFILTHVDKDVVSYSDYILRVPLPPKTHQFERDNCLLPVRCIRTRTLCMYAPACSSVQRKREAGVMQRDLYKREVMNHLFMKMGTKAIVENDLL